MKFFIVLACALAAASAGVITPVVHHGPEHYPIIDASGVPVDTAAVQQATAEHLVHKVEAHARNGDFVDHHHGVVHHPEITHHHPEITHHHPDHHHTYPEHHYTQGVIHHPEHHHTYPEHHHTPGVIHHTEVVTAPAHHAYPTHHGVPAVTTDGVPLDTPEVATAKVNHFAAHGEALARTGHAAYHHYARRAVYAYTPYSHYSAYPSYYHHLARRDVYTPYGYGYAAYPYAHYY